MLPPSKNLPCAPECKDPSEQLSKPKKMEELDNVCYTVLFFNSSGF